MASNYSKAALARMVNGDTLRERRERYGLTVNAVADALGMTPMRWAFIEDHLLTVERAQQYSAAIERLYQSRRGQLALALDWSN